MATVTDSQLATLEREARRARWVERHQSLLMLAAATCFMVAGMMAGLGVGHWLGAQQERAERVAEIGRLQGLLGDAIKQLGALTPKVEQAAATVAQTADEMTDRLGGAAIKLDEAASKAGVATSKASTAASRAAAAAAQAGTAAATAREATHPPATAVTRAVRETNQTLRENRR